MRRFLLLLLAGWLSQALLQAGLPSRYHDFAQIGDGGGFRSTFLITNQNADPVEATLRFFQDDGSPWSLTVADVQGTTYQTLIPARGMVRLVTGNQGSTPRSGWATLEAGEDVGAQVFFEILVDDSLVTQAAVESSGPVREAFLFVEEQPGTSTGVAIVNLAPAGTTRPVRVDLTLREVDGSVRRTTSITLQAGEHVAQFVQSLFSDDLSGELGNFRGSLFLRASGPVAVVTLQQTGLVLGTLPVIIRPF